MQPGGLLNGQLHGGRLLENVTQSFFARFEPKESLWLWKIKSNEIFKFERQGSGHRKVLRKKNRTSYMFLVLA